MKDEDEDEGDDEGCDKGGECGNEGSDECGEWLIYMGISDQRDQLYQLNHRGQ